MDEDMGLPPVENGGFRTIPPFMETPKSHQELQRMLTHAKEHETIQENDKECELLCKDQRNEPKSKCEHQISTATPAPSEEWPNCPPLVEKAHH